MTLKAKISKEIINKWTLSKVKAFAAQRTP
jgi:hypothetical protein